MTTTTVDIVVHGGQVATSTEVLEAGMARAPSARAPPAARADSGMSYEGIENLRPKTEAMLQVLALGNAEQ